MLRYSLGEFGRELIISDEALQTFVKCRQSYYRSKEAGGQLFAKFHNGHVNVVKVTEPHRLDKRGKYFFLPSRLREQVEINKNFKRGLHFIGDWHTHPQKHPIPYGDDKKSMKECFTKSKHELNGMLLVIIELGRNEHRQISMPLWNWNLYSYKQIG
jgi:integrative and conjugative element protein (TIGR02256 family)